MRLRPSVCRRRVRAGARRWPFAGHRVSRCSCTPSVDNEQDVVGQFLELAEHVRGDEVRRAVLGRVSNLLLEDPVGDRVEPSAWLVEDDE